MRVLIIKLSSMGDIVHTFPALSEARKYVPDLQCDWVVDTSFAEMPAWHSAVKDTIAIPLRALKNNIFANLYGGLFKQLWRALRHKSYDLIIDAQGLIKSALLGVIARGKSYGPCYKTARESLASCFYNTTIAIDTNRHAIDQTRELFAKAFGYQDQLLGNTRLYDFGITADINHNQKPYVFFLHGTTWDSKHWPYEYWAKLAALVGQHGFDVYATASNPVQYKNADIIAEGNKHVKIMPNLSLTAAKNLLKNAVAVVGVDTGFSHLAVALERPTIGLFGPTDPNHVGLTPPTGSNLLAPVECSPCYLKNCKFKESAAVQPCFQALTPDRVWAELSKIMGK